MPVALTSRRPVKQSNTAALIASLAKPKPAATAANVDVMGGAPRSNAKVAPAAVDPPFLPPGFDMAKGVAGLKQLLRDQGVSEDLLQPGKVQNLVTTDFDGTLGRSGNIPVFLRARDDVKDANGNVVMKAGDYFKDEKGNDLMIHGLTGVDVGQDLSMLKAKYPNLPWDHVTQDWSSWDDRALAMKTPLEPAMARRVADAGRASQPSASFIITARTNAQVAGGMKQHTGATGVICSGDANVQKLLGVDSPALSDGQRKAIIQMELITMYGSSLKSHSFADDGPANDAASIGSLAAKFPALNVKVYTATHNVVVDKDAKGKPQEVTSTPKLIAVSNGLGQMKDPRDGSLWTQDKLASFAASALPQLPQLTPDAVAGG